VALHELDVLDKRELIVLTGGTSRRFGSDKSVARIGDKSTLEWIVSTVPPDLPIIIVGPQPTMSWNHPAGIRVVRESPIGGGPVAGLFAGLQIATATMLLLVATDMPFVMTDLLGLVEDAREALEGADCILYRDNEGFLQPLAGLYKSAALRVRFAEIGDPYGQSMRQFISGLKVHELTMSKELSEAFLDIDTVEQLSAANTYANRYGSKHD